MFDSGDIAKMSDNGIPKDSPLRKPVNEDHARNCKEEELKRRPDHLKSGVFSASNLPQFTMSFKGEELSDFFPPPVKMTYDLIISAGDKQAKAVIESMEDMQRLHDGEAVEVNWYRLVGDEWEFVERRPLKINRQGIPE